MKSYSKMTSIYLFILINIAALTGSFPAVQSAERTDLSKLYESVAAEPVPSGNVKVQLLGINDWHGKIDISSNVIYRPNITFGRADYLAAYLKQRELQNKNSLIVHSGDMFGGSSPLSALLQDEPSVEIMEQIGLDVGTVGNHEFDEGVDELLRMVKGGNHPNGTAGYDGINFPIIAANIKYKDSGKLVFKPYTIIEVSGIKIGFIGVTTTLTPKMAMPSGIANISFTDEAAAINKYVPKLQSKGVEAIVVLAHLPVEQFGKRAKGQAAVLATKVNDAVDIIFTAHNHAKVNAVVDNKLIVQAWDYGKAFVDVDVEINQDTGDVVKKSAELVEVIQKKITPDPVVSGMIKKYENLVSSKINAIAGYNETAMVRGYPKKGSMGDNALGNFIADGMRFSMNSDFALINGGGIRDNLSAGEITWRELFNIQPFGNKLIKIEVTGDQLTDILNNMISPQYGPDAFIAGASYTWNPASNKIVRLSLINGEEIETNTTYSLTVNDFMYNQTAEKYKLIGQYGKNAVLGPKDVEASVRFAKSFPVPISYTAEGRISTDLLPPVTKIKVKRSKENFIRVSFGALDAGIGTKKTEYRINGGSWIVGNKLTIKKSSSHLIDYRSVDLVGNMENMQTIHLSPKYSR